MGAPEITEFAVLRLDRPIAFARSQEAGVIGIANLALILLSGGLAWLGERSLTIETLTAAVLYALCRVILRRGFSSLG